MTGPGNGEGGAESRSSTAPPSNLPSTDGYFAYLTPQP